MAAWLTSPDGGAVPAANLRKITVTAAEEAAFTGIGDARPRRSDVDQALLSVTAKARDDVSADRAVWNATRLYFYVSGHGIAPLSGEAALVLADANEDSLGQNIELSLYNQWYAACGYFSEVVMLADCCREQLGGTPPAIAPPFNLCAAPYGQTLSLVGYATGLGGVAYEPLQVPNPNIGRGYFTRALLAGLGGGAPDPLAAGAVTSRSLGPYVRDLVSEMTKSQKVRQEVQVRSESTRLILFRPAPADGAVARPKRAVTICFPAGSVGVAELQTGTFTSVGSWDMAKGQWSIDLVEGLYIVKAQSPGARAFAEGGLFKVLGTDRVVQL